MQKREITVRLKDDAGNTLSFPAGFEESGEFFTGKIEGELDGPTVEAAFNFMTIDGNGWRDIEASDCLEAFLRESYWGSRNPEDHLAALAKELSIDGEPGQVLVPF